MSLKNYRKINTNVFIEKTMPKNKRKYLFFLSALFTYTNKGLVKLLLTAAITDSHFEFRKEQYIKSLEILKHYGYENPYIVEALKKSPPTFLDTYSINVFYASSNNPLLKNHGINEAKTLLEALDYFNFAPDDMIIKLTGRHLLQSDSFLKYVERNSEYDLIMRINQEKTGVFTSLFAMKCNCLKEMLNSIDYLKINDPIIGIEYVVADYVLKKEKEGSLKICYIKKLDLLCDTYGSYTAPGASELYVQ